MPQPEESLEQAPLSRSVTTYICYLLLIFWGYVADFTRKIGLKVDGANSMIQDVSDPTRVMVGVCRTILCILII